MRTRVQVTSLSSTGIPWKDLGEMLGLVLTGIGVFVRLVVAPATKNYVREGMQPELEQVKKIPQLEDRVKRVEEAQLALAAVPAALARMEGLLEGLQR